MHRTFNCGIGMVVVVARNELKTALDVLAGLGVEAAEIGAIVEREGNGPQVVVV